MPQRPHIIVIDPAVRVAETDCFNRLALASPLPMTYHLPVLSGMDSLLKEKEGIHGIIILGSGSSVYDNLPWQKPLETWLMSVMEKKVPTIGMCYGHQMLAKMFGGKVDYLFPDHKKLQGFRTVDLKPNPLWGDKAIQGPLYVSHREIVALCPVTMEVTASSGEVSIEGLAHKELPIWSFQPHPEATTGFLANEGKTPPSDLKLFDFGHGLVDHFFKYVAKRVK